MREISERDGDRAAIGIFRRAVTLQRCNGQDTRTLAVYRPMSVVIGVGKMAGDDKSIRLYCLPDSTLWTSKRAKEFASIGSPTPLPDAASFKVWKA
jgi:hypothetical protein